MFAEEKKSAFNGIIILSAICGSGKWVLNPTKRKCLKVFDKEY